MRVFIVILLFSLLLPIQIFAIRLNPAPTLLSYTKDQQPLTSETIAYLGLVLSGDSETEAQFHLQELTKWTKEIEHNLPVQADIDTKADEILKLLHKFYLKKYVTNQTRLNELIETGNFNCVSSALAYMIIAKDLGLNVQAVATTDHAFCTLKTGSRTVDVETTIPYGFDPGIKTEFKDGFGKVTGFIYVPQGNYQLRYSTDERGLLGLMLQNLMAENQSKGDDEDNIGLAIDRWSLEKSNQSRGTLVNAFISYGAKLNQLKNYSAGLDLVDNMLSITGNISECKTLGETFLGNYISTLINTQQFDQAQNELFQYQDKPYISSGFLSKNRINLEESRLNWVVHHNPEDFALVEIEKAWNQHAITPVFYENIITYIYGTKAQKINQTQGPKAAALFLESLPENIKSLDQISKAINIFWYNWSIGIHNQFAKLYNAGSYVEAKKLIQDSLKEKSDSKILLDDIKSIP